jgi:hypothetical protein
MKNIPRKPIKPPIKPIPAKQAPPAKVPVKSKIAAALSKMIATQKG